MLPYAATVLAARQAARDHAALATIGKISAEGQKYQDQITELSAQARDLREEFGQVDVRLLRAEFKAESAGMVRADARLSVLENWVEAQK